MRPGVAISLASAGLLVASGAAFAETVEDVFIVGCVETFPDVRAANAVLKNSGFAQDGNNLTSQDGSMVGGAHMLAQDSIAYCALTGNAADTAMAEIAVLAALMDKWPDAEIKSNPSDSKGRTTHVMDVRGVRVVFGATQNDILGDGKIMLDLVNESSLSELTQ